MRLLELLAPAAASCACSRSPAPLQPRPPAGPLLTPPFAHPSPPPSSLPPSAPAPILYEKFGITKAKIVEAAKAMF